MLGTDGRPAPQRIPLHFLDAVVLVLFLGAAVHQYFGSPGLMVLNLTVSALLTAALVLFLFPADHYPRIAARPAYPRIEPGDTVAAYGNLAGKGANLALEPRPRRTGRSVICPFTHLLIEREEFLYSFQRVSVVSSVSFSGLL